MRACAYLVAVLLGVGLLAASSAADIKTMTYQGRVTDAAGDPVPDGNYQCDFALYTSAVGGTPVWQETGMFVTTVNGFFTIRLGTVNELSPAQYFEAYDSLWLEVTFVTEMLTPRTRLTAAPHAKIAEALWTKYSTDTTSVRTFSNNGRISTFGSDGKEQVRIYGPSWGEIFLYDEDAANNLTAVLSSNTNFGGYLRLSNDDASNAMQLSGGLTGDGSVILYSDAINADEMLNEPGIVSKNVSPVFFSLTGIGNYVVDSIEITVPTAGYVHVSASGYLNLWYDGGVYPEVWVGVLNNTTSSILTYGTNVCSVPSGSETGNRQIPTHCTNTFSVGAGTHKFYLRARYVSNGNSNTNLGYQKMVATFYPTLYGSFQIAASPDGDLPSDGSVAVTLSNERVITMAEHQARLAAERELMEAAYADELEALKRRVNDLEQVEDGVDR